jgi:hypothetical protein
MTRHPRLVFSIIALAAALAAPAQAQITLTSQSRSVSISSTPCGSPSASASDFAPFIQTVTVATGRVTQNSTLTSTSIIGTGNTSSAGTGGGPCTGITGSSSLSVTFTVAAPLAYTFAFANTTGGFFPTISLTGPGTNITYNISTMGTTPQSVSGIMQPGSYTIAANASGGPQSGTLGSVGWSINLTVGPGACCAATTGACTIVAPADCTGTYLGNGSACPSNPCTGACCNRWTGNCVVTDPPTCAAYGLMFNGFNAGCSPATCHACPADFNGASGITVQDIFDFLGAWFAGCH